VTLWEAELWADRGRLVRREAWRDRWWTKAPVGDLWQVVPVDPRTLVLGNRRVALGSVTTAAGDVTTEDFLADDYTLEPFPRDTTGPLSSISLPDVFSATPVSFGEFAPGRYRVVYERGAIFYGGTKNQLRINAYSTSANGFKIQSGATLYNAPGFNAGLDDVFRYAADDPRTVAQIVEDIAARESGRFVEFDHAGGAILMFLSDSPYTDNAPTTEFPTFSLYVAG
jgi:hypothetical protein